MSLLAAFLAARFCATLDDIGDVVDVVENASSVAAPAEVLRSDDEEDAVTSISAARGVRRRMRSVVAALLAIVTLVPELAGCAPTLAAIRAHLGVQRVLVHLRDLGRVHLGALAPPLGLRARRER